MRDKVVIYPKPKEEVTKGGVHIPLDAQKFQIVGIVVAVGPDVPTEGPSGLKEGDTVVFPQYHGTEVTLEDEHGEEQRVLIMDYDGVIAKIEEA